MKFRIDEVIKGPLVIYIMVDLFEDTADTDVDPPITSLPLIIRGTETLKMAATRLLDHLDLIEALYANSKTNAQEREIQFQAIRKNAYVFSGVVLTSDQLREYLNKEEL